MTDVSTNPVTAWRRALVELLEGQFADADVLNGYRTGLSRDKDRIAVYWLKSPIDMNVNYLRPRMAVRFFARMPKASAKLREVQRDDAPLEQAAWDIATLLMPVRTTLVANLYFELGDFTPNRVDFSTGVELAAWVVNPASLPA